MNQFFQPPHTAVTDAVTRALNEDLTPLGDVTGMLLPPTATATANYIARTDGVLAGCACANETIRQVDPTLQVTWHHDDGDHVAAGEEIGTISGNLRTMLIAERTSLNFLSHLSGIATLTHTFVVAAAAHGGTAKVWDTRKTTPGLRSLQKAAVRAGGGRNHRGNLSDWILIKDNHLAGLTITEAVARARDFWPARTVHVECDRLELVEEALAAHADALLLDNMSLDELRTCVAAAQPFRGGTTRPLLEASGGVTLDTIGMIATTGVDQISVGALTNSAPVLDIGLDIEVH